MKYSDFFLDVLAESGYTHCYYVGGGNVMHLVDSARTRFTCVPVVHEVSACIAAEYFNEIDDSETGRAFVLVTAGPGITNCITGISGAWLESRELLVVGGQARVEYLSHGTVRQIGHQEIDGVALTRPITKASVQFDSPRTGAAIKRLVQMSREGRKGPVFIEMCLDVSAMHVDPIALEATDAGMVQEQAAPSAAGHDTSVMMRVATELLEAQRPVLLLGGGLSRSAAKRLLPELRELGIPVMTTWNGADRVGSDETIYAGRPQVYGMRYSNVVLQQSDYVVAVGTRLGLQLTGFDTSEFVPMGRIVQVDIDEAELAKGKPALHRAVAMDAGEFLRGLLLALSGARNSYWMQWMNFTAATRTMLPVVEPANIARPEFIEAYRFVEELAAQARATDQVIPCSSGGAFTTMMQAFGNLSGQSMVTNMGLASMGYGLAGAIGAAMRHPELRTILVEGDGGFAQNLQEIGTVVAQRLNLKICIFDNDGYASIKTSQRAYFDGQYVGCDRASGLFLPDWLQLFRAYDVPVVVVEGGGISSQVRELLESDGPGAVIVRLDPEQQFFPKITSRISADGSMKSNPLHEMTPPLTDELRRACLPWM